MWGLYWPVIATMGLMSIMWIITLASPSEQSRKMAFLGWIVLIVLALHIYYLVIVLNGSMADAMCKEEDVFNRIEGSTNLEECKAEKKNWLLVDATITWVLDIYFAYAIMKWSKNGDESWERA